MSTTASGCCLLIDLDLLIVRWWRDFKSYVNLNGLIEAAWSTALNGFLRSGLPIQSWPQVFNWTPTKLRQWVTESLTRKGESHNCTGGGSSVGGTSVGKGEAATWAGGCEQPPVGSSGWKGLWGWREDEQMVFALIKAMMSSACSVLCVQHLDFSILSFLPSFYFSKNSS